jgi:ABC-type transport system involved in Fe-S cluster assembly fused permease/ATPase subunit
LSFFKHFLFYYHIVALVAIAYCIIISYTQYHTKYAYTFFLVFFCFGLKVEAKRKSKKRKEKNKKEGNGNKKERI